MPLPKFNYDTQTWQDAEGNTVEQQENWDFSCPYCHTPAKMHSYDFYYEYYTCLEKGHTFKLN